MLTMNIEVLLGRACLSLCLVFRHACLWVLALRTAGLSIRNHHRLNGRLEGQILITAMGPESIALLNLVLRALRSRINLKFISSIENSLESKSRCREA